MIIDDYIEMTRNDDSLVISKGIKFLFGFSKIVCLIIFSRGFRILKSEDYQLLLFYYY